MKILTRIRYLPYRVMRRFAIANICCFFAAEFGELATTQLPERMVFTELSPPMLDALCNEHPELFSDEHVGFLDQNQARGFAVFDGDCLASFLWLAIEKVPGSMNHGGHPGTELPLDLPNGMGYIFRAFVMPEYRGRQLYGAMISELSKQLQVDGFTGLMLTTEGSNYRALRSVRRIGFQLLGRSTLFGVGRFTRAKYPPQPMAGGIQTGRYKGDSRI